MVHDCQHCGAYVEAGCEPAHANGAEWGKGMSMKAGDGFHAALCHSCHAELDQGRAARVDKRAMWTAAHFKHDVAFTGAAGGFKVTP
jgi:hypothetical protein